MFDQIPIFIKTTHADPELRERLHWFCQQPGCIWLENIRETAEMPELTITRRRVTLTTGAEQLSFHPSMALIRLINLLREESDRYLEATQLKPGDSLIDATLGLGTDALIGAWAVGEIGSVLGVEQSPILAAMVQDGLNHFEELIPKAVSSDKQKAWASLAQASGRIKVLWGDHREIFKSTPGRSCDVVYFDPMFRRTCQQSGSIRPLHYLSDHSPLEPEVIQEACRIARRRVVLKERKNSSEFSRLGFEILKGGGRYSPVDYGIILV